MPRLVAFGLALASLLGPLSATDWFVNAANPNPGTGTKLDPYRSLTQAATVATAGDRIFVAQGLYSPTTTGEVFPITFGVILQTNLQIIAPDGPLVTIIDGGGGNSANGLFRFRLGATGARMIGFTIRNYAGTIGAIRLGSVTAGFEASGVEIARCIIRDCTFGSGIATFGASDQLKIHDNWIVNCLDNGIWCSDTTCNAPGGGGAVWNNTIVSCGNGIRLQGGTWSVSNNIVAFSTNNGIFDFGLAGAVCAGAVANYSTDFNALFGNGTNYGGGLPPGPNDLLADPLFVNPAGGDFHLTPASPCRDAGSTALPAFMAVDFDGDSRATVGPSGQLRPDLGADEVTDVRLQPLGPASISGGVAGYSTFGPPGDFEFKALALGDARLLLPGIGYLMLDLTTLLILDPVPNLIPSNGDSPLAIPIGSLPPSAIGAAVFVQAAVGGVGGGRLTNSVLTIIEP